MTLMKRRLPNLNAVRAFDAAARHQSFSRAADELNVTHASVSRYIKNLEEELGVELFERRHRQVALTPAGSRYAEIVADALMLISIETGTKATRDAKGKVVLECDSDFALLWLMPLLEETTLDELDIQLELRSYSEPPRTIAPDTDIAITWGPLDVSGFNRELFLHFTSFPVCAPQLESRVREGGPTCCRLIHDRGMSAWDEALKRKGASVKDAKSHLTFHRTYLSLDAAVRGLGVAIGDDVTAAAMLRAGRLVRPCGPDMPGRKAFYISSTARQPMRPPVAALKDWLMGQAERHSEWAEAIKQRGQ